MKIHQCTVYALVTMMITTRGRSDRESSTTMWMCFSVSENPNIIGKNQKTKLQTNTTKYPHLQFLMISHVSSAPQSSSWKWRAKMEMAIKTRSSHCSSSDNQATLRPFFTARL